ncbi:MAG: thrombospondin, partial [Polyangiales bacterium]
MPRALHFSRFTFVTGAVVASALAAPRPTHAANCDAYASACVDSDALWATGGHSTFFAIPSAITVAPGSFAFGLASSVQHDPIVFRTSNQGPAGSTSIAAISTQVVSTFLFSYGVTDRLQLDVALPLTLFQNGIGTSRIAGTTEVDVPSNGARDVRLGA